MKSGHVLHFLCAPCGKSARSHRVLSCASSVACRNSPAARLSAVCSSIILIFANLRASLHFFFKCTKVMELTSHLRARRFVLTPQRPLRQFGNHRLPKPKSQLTWWTLVNKIVDEWNVYRSRFLIRAKRLKAPLVFVDAMGQEHRGKKGDYLVESCSGLQRIWPRRLFENAHVPLNTADFGSPALAWVSAVQSDQATSRISESPSPLRKNADCGKASARSRIPAVNSLRYNI